MGRRALIIGIENYAAVSDGSIEREVPGSRDAALAFRAWLEAKWSAENVPENDRQIVFCSQPTVPGGRPAALEDINQALMEIRDAGLNETDEFYFFFGGHGFSFVSAGSRADQLIAANYKSMKLSGASACLHLDKMIYWLRQELGPGKQYYFVDACRNELDGTKIAGGTFGLPQDPQTSGEAMSFLLQSTIPAATAAADDEGRFPRELLEGLKGRSIAKTWDEVDDDAMLVRYDTLRIFMTDRMKNQPIYNKVEGAGGEADGIIVRLKPAPTTRCELRIEGAIGAVAGTVLMSGRRTGRSSLPLTGEVTNLVVKPDRYTMSVDLNNAKVRDNDRSVLLFEDNAVTFQVDKLPTLEASTGPALSDILVPPNASIELREINTGEIQTFDADTKNALPGGSYSATMRDRDSLLVSSILHVGSGDAVNLADWANKTAQASIAASGFPVVRGAVDLSESLGGPLADPDLNVWLAVIGAGRIMNGIFGRIYSKIGALPLQDFRPEKPGACPIYVLAGFDDPDVKLKVAVTTREASPKLTDVAQPADLKGIRELYVPMKSAGPQLISFKLGDQEAYTVASLASRNRATLITLTLDEDGAPVLAQYLLPLGEHVEKLDPYVWQRLRTRNQLADVKTLAQAMRAFRSRRDLRRIMSDRVLDEMLYMKWVDPIATALCAYELIRRGQRGSLAEVAHNLEKYFPDLPDGAALARLAGISRPEFESIPLFLDGLRAYEGIEQKLPIPSSRLDYANPWTAWRGLPTGKAGRRAA